MTTQSSLTVIAEIRRENIIGLQSALNKITSAPGWAVLPNSSIPFGSLETLHFARFVILNDQTLEDINLLYGRPAADYPLYLSFMCDFDGEKDEFLSRLIGIAGSGLCSIFIFCEGFSANCDLKQWLLKYDQPVAANYFNWRGRTVVQAKQEAALRTNLGHYLRVQPGAFEPESAGMLWQKARKFKIAEEAAGRLDPLVSTPRSREIARVLSAICSLVWVLAFLLPYLFVVAFSLRRQEQTDPQYYPELTDEHARQLSNIEDLQFKNQFTVIGSLKPGLAWRFAMRYAFAVVDLAAQYFYVRGHLARIRTIHAARWVFLDGGRRVMFASTYDGSLESYMDDFINKAYFGLNLAFAGGITYPRTKWILGDGAWEEQKFKYVLRRHQVPTQVWYDAYAGVTAIEMERNASTRKALEQGSITDEAARQWLQFL